MSHWSHVSFRTGGRVELIGASIRRAVFISSAISSRAFSFSASSFARMASKSITFDFVRLLGIGADSDILRDWYSHHCQGPPRRPRDSVGFQAEAFFPVIRHAVIVRSVGTRRTIASSGQPPTSFCESMIAPAPGRTSLASRGHPRNRAWADRARTLARHFAQMLFSVGRCDRRCGKRFAQQVGFFGRALVIPPFAHHAPILLLFFRRSKQKLSARYNLVRNVRALKA